MKRKPSGFLLGLVHSLAWVSCLLVVTHLFSHSDARAAYASISAWFVTLYLALLLRTPATGALTFVASMIAVFIGDTLLDGQLLWRRDAGGAGAVFSLFVNVFVWISPFVINMAAVAVAKKLERLSV